MAEDNRLKIFEVDKGGKERLVYTGPSEAELLEKHKNGTCGFLCSYCYQEACDYMKTQPESSTL
jgi:hypothetical protein